ncbi:MAG: hypothetical protein LBI28_04110 [Treponema sp.]|jgi:hypothetical protein|nr:hypothetical protein [Treponema sp.]
MGKIIVIITTALLFLYFLSRTIYSYYEYYKKNIGKKVFSIGRSSQIMRLLGVYPIISLFFYELQSIIKGITYIYIQNTPIVIVLSLINLFYIYFGYKKIVICENGIKTPFGCWKWTEIESYEWKYTYITNTMKIIYLWITIPKNKFLLGNNKVRLKIYQKEYLLYKDAIEKLLYGKSQTSD